METYNGSCHCGKVRFEATLQVEQAMACNCSICARKRTLMAFVKTGEFKLLQGKDALQDYQFGKKRLHHLFCKHCGIHTHGLAQGADGKENFCISLNCLENFDAEKLPVSWYDGKAV